MVTPVPDNSETPPGAPGPRLTCRVCGRTHAAVQLAPGERATCVRCGSPLAKGSRFGLDKALAYAATGLILAVPATLLPFVTVAKLNHERVGGLFTGVATLWTHGMRMVGVWVAVCGALIPFLLLGTLAALALPARLGLKHTVSKRLSVAAHAFQHWAMPEVQVLAVLVALVKLHTLVNVTIGPGFWCYAAMSFMIMLAWHSFDLESVAAPAPEVAAPDATLTAPAPITP